MDIFRYINKKLSRHLLANDSDVFQDIIRLCIHSLGKDLNIMRIFFGEITQETRHRRRHHHCCDRFQRLVRRRWALPSCAFYF